MNGDNCYPASKSSGNPDVARHPHVSDPAIAPEAIKLSNHATSAQSPSGDLKTARCDSNYLPPAPFPEKVEIAGALIAIGPSKTGKEFSS